MEVQSGRLRRLRRGWSERLPPAKGVAAGHELTLGVYQVTAGFPREELYGLTTQMRRASSSIAANLAEGCGRNGDAELNRFCSIALGSASELQYFLRLARDLHLLAGGDYDRLAETTTEVKRMLTGLVQKLKAVG